MDNFCGRCAHPVLPIGINIFLAGFVPTENLRFRQDELTFQISETAEETEEEVERTRRYSYPAMAKTLG